MKDKLHIRFLWLLVPFLAASCLYLFLYQYNNKYTRTTIQPANGLLILSEKELQTDPVRFLKSGLVLLSRPAAVSRRFFRWDP